MKKLFASFSLLIAAMFAISSCGSLFAEMEDQEGLNAYFEKAKEKIGDRPIVSFSLYANDHLGNLIGSMMISYFDDEGELMTLSYMNDKWLDPKPYNSILPTTRYTKEDAQPLENFIKPYANLVETMAKVRAEFIAMGKESDPPVEFVDIKLYGLSADVKKGSKEIEHEFSINVTDKETINEKAGAITYTEFTIVLNEDGSYKI